MVRNAIAAGIYVATFSGLGMLIELRLGLDTLGYHAQIDLDLNVLQLRLVSFLRQKITSKMLLWHMPPGNVRRLRNGVARVEQVLLLFALSSFL